MSEKDNKVGLVGFTILTTVSMTDGIIMLPTMVAQVGSISIYSWIITTISVMILAFAFSRCGMYNRKTGGLGGYAEYVFGKSGNFLANYSYAIALLVANVGIAISVVAYTSAFLDITLPPLQAAFWASVVLVLTTVANFFGTKKTVQIGFVAMMLKVVPACIMCVLGLWYFDSAIFKAAWNPHGYTIPASISAANSFTLWAFLGFESACSNMDCVENPTRNVPIAVILATAFIGIFSIAYTTVIQGIVPNDQLAVSNGPFGLAFATMFGPEVGHFIMALMIMGCAGALIAWQFTLGELLRSGGHEGYFPPSFDKVNKRGVPVHAMVVMMAIQIVMILFTVSPTLVKQFDVLVQLATVDNLVPYIMAMAALDVMQKSCGHNDRTTRVAAIFGALYSLYAIYSCGADAVMYGSLAVFLGFLFYGLFAGRWVVPFKPGQTNTDWIEKQ